MAKGKGSSSSKKKGPKGKKARAKAKKDRQWGEDVVEPVEMRRGKSRLLKPTKKPRAEPVPSARMSDGSSSSSEEEDDSIMEEDQEDELENKAFSNLMSAISSNQNPSNNIASDDDLNATQSSEASDNDEEEEQESENEASLVLQNFFTSRFGRTECKPATNSSKSLKFCINGLSKIELQCPENALATIGLDRDSDIGKWKNYCKAYYRSSNQERIGWSLRSQSCSCPLGLLPPLLTSYHDILWTLDSRKSRPASQSILCQHVAEHVWRSRTVVGKNNREIAAAEEEEETATDEQETERKDQGYCRPTVLVLLPTRGLCHAFVQELISILPCQFKDEDENLSRFDGEFGPLPSEEEPGDEKGAKYRKQALARKGKDWKELFGDTVNDDDDFKLGLSVSPRKPKSDGLDRCEVRLYTDFNKSDIILASPLGLKMATTDDEGNTNADFLSSIEICLVGRADVMLMQNWDHVTDVLGMLNSQPKQTNNTDFSRVRPYFLAGEAAAWRQLVVTSEFIDPMLLSAMKTFSTNYQGSVRVRCPTTNEDAALNKVILPVKQVFQRITCSSLLSQGSDRVEYFCEKVLPLILKNEQHHTMVFVASYFDFVSLRNLLLENSVSFCSVTEYSRTSEVGRGRARFLQGRKQILLYTGRAHYFMRHAMKGIRHLIFLGLPEHCSFYTDHVNIIGEGLRGETDDTDVASCLALFTKYEAHALERIVGSSICRRMQGETSTFIFSS